MKYKTTTLEAAYADLRDIKKYLAQLYPGTIKKFIDLYKSQIAHVKDFPYSCPVYEDDTDYRKLVVGDYLVFYVVNEDAKTIEIHRVFHGSRNIKGHLQNNTEFLYAVAHIAADC